MRLLETWNDVPAFADEEEEAAFWEQASPAARLMQSSLLRSADTRESATVTLRMDPRMLARLKRLARSRYLNYQSMVKQWLAERLEREARESSAEADRKTD